MCQHIYNENTILSIMILNKLEECLIVPWMTFAQIYQLNGWGQYGIQGSIVNVPISVDKMQIILPRPTTCESTIMVCIKRKIKYKSPYLSGYVQAKIVMKALHDLCDTPLYKEEKC